VIGFQNRGWLALRFVALRMTSAIEGTLVELFHYGLSARAATRVQRTPATKEALTQLKALRQLAET